MNASNECGRGAAVLKVALVLAIRIAGCTATPPTAIVLIDDQKLRATAIAAFNGKLLDTIQEKAENSDYRKEFRRTTPAPVQHALLQSCGDRMVTPGDYKGIVGLLDYSCNTDLAPAQVAVAAAALKANPALLPALQERFADLETAGTDLRNNRSR